MAITFNPRAGQYRDESGKFIKRSEVVAALDEEVLQLQGRLARLQERLAAGEIDLSTFSRLARAELKPALSRSAMLGAGGREAFLDSNRQIGTLGAQAKLTYGSLKRLTQQLANGELTLGQAIDRSRRLANFAVGAFSRAEQLSRVEHGFLLAERTLDPGSRHCPDCPALVSGGFVPIDQVTPLGMGCRCGGRCRCQIRYRRGSLKDLPDLSPNLTQSVLDRQAAAAANAPSV